MASKKKTLVRRAPGTGNVQQHGKSWRLLYSVDELNDSGKLVPRKLTKTLGSISELTEEQANGMADEFLAAEKDKPSPRMSLRAFCEGDFKRNHIDRKKPSGQGHWRTILNNHVLPAFGDRRLDSISGSDVDQLIRLKLEAEYSTQTCLHIRNCISGIYRYAIKKEIYHRVNPASGVEMPEMVREPRHALTLEQAGQLVQALSEKDLRAAVAVTTCLLTSLNRAEVLALKWGRVNLTAHPMTADGENLPPFTLRVQENWYRDRWSSVKCSTRERLTPLPMVLVQAFLALRQQAKWVGPNDCVFAGTRADRPLDHRSLERRVLKPVYKALDMEWVSWHVFRHSWASFADQLKFEVTDRMAGMGHSRLQMTLRYTHRQLESRRAGVEQMASRMLVSAQAEGLVSEAEGMAFNPS